MGKLKETSSDRDPIRVSEYVIQDSEELNLLSVNGDEERKLRVPYLKVTGRREKEDRQLSKEKSHI